MSSQRIEQVLERSSDETWLLMENSAGAGGTIGRSIEELATLHERLGGIHGSASASTRATSGCPAST